MIKSFVTSPGKTSSTIELKLFSGIHLLKAFRFEAFIIASWVRVLQTKVQVGVIFDEKYFYRLLGMSIL